MRTVTHQRSNCYDIVMISVCYDVKDTDVPILIRNATAIAAHGQFVIVDNGPSGSLPSDIAELIAPDNPARVTVVPYRGNRGFGVSSNVGLAGETATPFILFVNPDAEISAGMIEALLATFAGSPMLGIISPSLTDRTGAIVESGGSFPTILRLALGKFRRPPRLARNASRLIDPLGSDLHLPVDWVSGAVMMVRREVWEATSGFCPSFFLYYEDIALCRRVRAAGWEVGIVPGATAIHESGGSQWRPGTRTRVERIYFESQAYYFRKHYGRLMEWVLRAVRFPYLATSLRRRFLERYGVRIRVVNDPA